MANKNLYTGTYPVVSLTGINNLGTNDIKSVRLATGVTALMNGMGVVVDELAEEASLPTAITDTVWLHASVEKLYNGEATTEFAIKNNNGFLARVYRLKEGQTFETNAIVYDDATYATVGAIATALASAPLYVIPSTAGTWTLTAVAPTTVPKYGKVKSVVTLPNLETGLEIVVAYK